MLGVSVGFLGIDGIGKRLVVEAVELHCTRAGLPVRRVSWQRQLSTGSAGYPSADLERLWLDLYRLFFGGASVDGRPLAVPATVRELSEQNLHPLLHTARIDGMRAEAPLSTAWAEVAGHTLLHQAVVPLMTDAGDLVLLDSLGIKNVVKSLVMAQLADAAREATLAPTLELVARYFGEELAPDLGFHLVGDPEEALRGIGQAAVSPFDSMRAFGLNPEESYRQVQRRCAAEFERFATAYGWRPVDLRGADQARLRAVGRELAESIVEFFSDR